MAASITDKITDVRNAARPNSARVSSGRSAGGTTLVCDNLAGWPTASKVHFVTYQIDSNSDPVAGTQLDCYGIVSGNDIGSFTVADGTDTGNAVNDVVEMLPTAAWGQDLADALTNQHSRLGAHVGVANTGGMTNTGGLTTDTLTASGNATVGGTLGVTGVATFTAVPLLPSGTVTPEDLVASSGTSWTWQDWTPTFGNLSGGTLNAAKYIQIGKTVHFYIKYTLAGAGVAGSVTFSPPVTISSNVAANTTIGWARYNDTGTTDNHGFLGVVSTTSIIMAVYNAASTYLVGAALSSTVPFTWASTDVIFAAGTYEAA